MHWCIWTIPPIALAEIHRIIIIPLSATELCNQYVAAAVRVMNVWIIYELPECRSSDGVIKATKAEYMSC